MGWGRTFSFSSYSYTGVGQGHPNAPDVNSMARAAASSVGNQAVERANSGLSSAAAATAIRRHSLTSATSPPEFQRNGSLRGNRDDRTNSLRGRTSSLRGNSLRGGGFASVSGTSASGRPPSTLIEEETIGDLPNVRTNPKRGTRTYSLTTPFKGFDDGPGSSSPASSMSSNRTSSMRHSLRGNPPSPDSLRRHSMTTTNTERTHSLTSTTTTIKRMGSFHVITTKTHQLPTNGKLPPATTNNKRVSVGPRDLLAQQRQERDARQAQLNKANRARVLKSKPQQPAEPVQPVQPVQPPSPVNYASSVLSYESDLNTVSEYPESSVTSPNGSVGSMKRNVPSRALSPMKPALKTPDSRRHSFNSDSLSTTSSIESPSRSRKHRVSFTYKPEANFIQQESQRQKAMLSQTKAPLQPRPKQFIPGTVVPISNNQLANNGLPKVIRTPERQSQLAQEQAHQQALQLAKRNSLQTRSPRQSPSPQPQSRTPVRTQSRTAKPRSSKSPSPQPEVQHVQKAAVPKTQTPVKARPVSTSESEEDLSMFQDAKENLDKAESKSDSRFGSGVLGTVAGAVSGAVSGAVAVADEFGKQMQFPSETTLSTHDDESTYSEPETAEVTETEVKPAELQPAAELKTATEVKPAESVDTDDLPTPTMATAGQFTGSPSSPSMRRNYRQYALGDDEPTEPIEEASPIVDYSEDVERPRDSVYSEEEEEEEDVPIKPFGNLKTSPRLGPVDEPALASSSPKNSLKQLTLDSSPTNLRQSSPPKRVGFAAEEVVVEHVPHPEGPMDDTASIDSDSSWRRERRNRMGINSDNGGVDDQGYRLTLRDDGGYGREMAPQEPVYSMRAPQFRKPKEEPVAAQPQHGFASLREQNHRASFQPVGRRSSISSNTQAPPTLVRSNSASSFDRSARTNSMSAFRMGSMREPRSLRQDAPVPVAAPVAAPLQSRFADTDSDDEGFAMLTQTSPKKKRGRRFFSSASREDMRPPAPPAQVGLSKKLFASTKTLKKQQAEAQAQAQAGAFKTLGPEPPSFDSSLSSASGRQKKFGKLRRVFGLD